MKKISLLISLFLVGLTSQGLALVWWGEEITSLKYIMPIQYFVRNEDVFYMGLQNFGIDRVIYNNYKLSRDKVFRFSGIMDPSVKLNFLLKGDMLIVGGIYDGFLALDTKSDYPSPTSKRHDLVFKPNENTIVYSSLLKSLLWKGQLVLLTADQVILGSLQNPLKFNVNASVGLAPNYPLQPNDWKEFWATDMALYGNYLYVLLAHEKTPQIAYLNLSQPLESLKVNYVPLNVSEYYLKSLAVSDSRLYITQNKTLHSFVIDEEGMPTVEWSHTQKHFIETVTTFSMGIILSFFEAGLAFFENQDLTKEQAIIFPPKTWEQVEVVDNLLFGSAGEDGFYVYQKYN
ncbi:MAG: hypothetical protein HYS98_03230 [Deltaproteobacteria bacterium]|nr:hypothetical protein [Deltaproteobacteria bacterium]